MTESKLDTTRRIRAELVERWPALFNEGKPVPTATDWKASSARCRRRRQTWRRNNCIHCKPIWRRKPKPSAKPCKSKRQGKPKPKRRKRNRRNPQRPSRPRRHPSQSLHRPPSQSLHRPPCQNPPRWSRQNPPGRLSW